MERQIATALRARIGTPVAVHCPTPVACSAVIGDTQIPILVTASKPAWTWRVDGLLVVSDALETYVAQEVADLGAPQRVRCAPRVRVLHANDRVDCWLERGGKAFVTVAADGQTSVEIELDKVAAEARSEVLSAQKEEALSRLSRALEHEENSDGEEATAVDGGVDDGGTVPPL